jgi:hypothetical protein
MPDTTIATNAPAGPAAADLSVGEVVLERTIGFSRADLVRYAGASGDFNYIHWNERFAREVGLPNVIAHGMLTMATVVSPIVQWLGDPGAVLDYRTRFTSPVVVPDATSGVPEEPTAFVNIVAKVGALDPEAGTARIDVTATLPADGDAKPVSVLGRTQVKVALR